MSYPLTTPRLSLRPFTTEDLPDFFALHSDPASMKDLGGPISRAEAREKLNGYLDHRARDGIARLHVSDSNGFIGYVGVLGHDNTHPLGAHLEIGWRLLPGAWGQGYACEAASTALTDAFARTSSQRILAYTSPDNARSRAVMGRLGLIRKSDLDFVEPYAPLGTWPGQVWIARREDWKP